MKNKFSMGLGGRYKMEAINLATGKKRFLAEFDNLISDIGLNRLGTGGVLFYCHVGSGSATSVNADTALQTWIASTNATIGAADYGVQASPPYFGHFAQTFRFAAGVAEGNISEVGMGWNISNGSMFSRALVLDSFGDPTTITVLDDEVLDVTYEIRMYPPLDDAEYTIDIGGVSHDIVMRAAEVTSIIWSGQSVWGSAEGFATVLQPSVFNGAVGATIVDTPSGTTGYGSNSDPQAYSNNSLELTWNLSFGLVDANVAGGISAMQFIQGYRLGCFQCSVDPPIAKDATKVLSFPVTISWGRH